MSITLFGISNCDKVRKARSWLQQQNLDYVFHDYRKDGLQQDLARELLRQFPLQQLINTRGTSWRQLPETVKQTLHEGNAIELMQKNPALIKRPLLQASGKWLLGFEQARWHALLCS